MSNSFHPGQGGPLAPPGFERKDPRPDSTDYVARHPTRYGWREDVEELIRLIYRQFGGPDDQQMNTYVNHPPNKFGRGIWIGFETQNLSLDVWGPGGRGVKLPEEQHRKIYRFLFNLKGAPDWWWAISLGDMWQRNRDPNTLDPQWEGHIREPPEGPPDSDPEHNNHMHLTLLAMEDQLVLRPNYTIRKGVERLRRM
jgi:hypothetical protein